LATVNELKDRGIAFRSLTEQMDTTTPQGEFLFHIFGALAQFERSLIQERVRAGLAAARHRGRRGGRPIAIDIEKLSAIVPLAARFGFADVSSSDGQAFLTAGRGEALGAHNARHGHGREPSALFYTHVSSRHAPFHTASVPPSSEAAYVIDGLLYHEADLSIAVHHTDGGGVSDHVFALAHLLGFRFAPRIPNLADRKLYAFGPASTWPALAPFIAGRPDEKLITAQRFTH
jgi:TnpA family transposase